LKNIKNFAIIIIVKGKRKSKIFKKKFEKSLDKIKKM